MALVHCADRTEGTAACAGVLYAAFSNALVELFCGMTPAEARTAARANPGTTTSFRFR